MGFQEKFANLLDEYNLVAGRYGYNSHQHDARSSPGLTALVDRATKGANHVFFGEPHIDGMVVKQYEMMAHNPEMFKAAAANGVKHLALEFPNELQPDLDKYQSGAMSRVDFSQRLNDFDPLWFKDKGVKEQFKENLIKTIDNASAAGMSVHFADLKVTSDLKNMYPPSVQLKELELAADCREKFSDIPLQSCIAEQSAKLPIETLAQLQRDIEAHQERWAINRVDDTAQFLYLRERVKPNEGIMGVVGMSHLNNSMDQTAGHKIMGIDDYLESEGKKVTTIEVHTGKTKGFTRDLAVETGRIPQDPPDYVIDLDKRTIESQQDGAITGMDSAIETRLTEQYRQPSVRPAANNALGYQ